jgi:hypothetical protein
MKGHQPDLLADLFDADTLTGEHQTQIDLASPGGALLRA